MILKFGFNGHNFQFDSDVFFDLSISIRNGAQNANAYFINEPKITPFCIGSFVGSVEKGGACNCEDITFNAHGNGTHTEGVGHITAERYPIYEALTQTLLIAKLISIEPSLFNGNLVITPEHLKKYEWKGIDACILRTLPNGDDKKTKQYSGKNPIYLLPETAAFLSEKGVEHLLLDLPSVDKEEDGGALLAHRAFWNYPENPRMHATITEMIYAPPSVKDDLYLMNLQIASFHSDASPSRPILFPLTKV